MQGEESTRVRGETPGREVTSHPRQQVGVRGGVEGANITEGMKIGAVAKKRKLEGPELVGNGGRGRRAESQRSGGKGAAMRSSGHRIPNGEAPAEGSARAPVGGPGNGERPRAFLCDTEGDVAYGFCRVTLQLGHRAGYVLHADKGAMCSTPVVWLKPSREAWHRHHSAAQQSAAEPNTQDGTH